MYLPPCDQDETRIGFSIPVPPPWAEEIQQARIRYHDDYAEMIPTHITIIGPTAVKFQDLPAITVHLDIVCDNTPPFMVELAGTGTFRPTSDVSFIRVTTGFAECTALQARANKGVLARPMRFPYHPHVTLAHGVAPAYLDSAEHEFANLFARFQVDTLWLYLHDPDGVWRKYSKFALRGVK